jgi:N-carbamoyl-L-amino-acid hydrolase
MFVDTDSFLQDLDTLRRISAYKTGVRRPSYSPDDMESRRWLMWQMAEVGLEPVMDGIGNILSRRRPAMPQSRRHPLQGRLRDAHRAGHAA